MSIYLLSYTMISVIGRTTKSFNKYNRKNITTAEITVLPSLVYRVNVHNLPYQESVCKDLSRGMFVGLRLNSLAELDM